MLSPDGNAWWCTRRKISDARAMERKRTTRCVVYEKEPGMLVVERITAEDGG